MINLETIAHVAGLAKLELTNDELALYSEQLSAIIGHFEQLSNVDTKNVEPLKTPSEITQHLRGDVAEPSDIRGELMANAPDKNGHLFKVPPVV